MAITLITIVHVFVCLVLVGVVLLQQGKGADMGATFGGGSQTLFGAGGADNLLTRVTTFCAAIFMVTSIILALSSKHAVSGGSSLFQNVSTKSAAESPAANNTPSAGSATSTATPAASTAAPATAPATTTSPTEGAPAAAAPTTSQPTPAAPTEAPATAAAPAAPQPSAP